MTADAGRFQPAGAAELILHEGKTFHQYTDCWDTKPRYSVASDCDQARCAAGIIGWCSAISPAPTMNAP